MALRITVPTINTTHIYKGNNSRLDEIQAAFLAKLPRNLRMNVERRELQLSLQKVLRTRRFGTVLLRVVPVWHIYGIADWNVMRWKSISTRKASVPTHYPIPMHLRVLQGLGIERYLPIAEEIAPLN